MTRRGSARIPAALLAVLALLPLYAAPGGAIAADTPPARDVGQYFDRFTRDAGPANFEDNSSHPLRGLTSTDNTLLFGVVDCLRCHYASGASSSRKSDECLKCHFESQPNAPAPNHGNGKLELAVPDGNDLPKSAASISSIQEYDAWCLSCHRRAGTGPNGQAAPVTTLGNLVPRGKSAIDNDAFARGRHRNVSPRRGEGPVGCIHCHSPHGSGNAHLVRSDSANRRAAGNVPARFGVFPNDNLGAGGYGAPRIVSYLSRVDRNVADADEDFRYCNTSCHRSGMDHRILRDEATGNYLLTAGRRMVHIVEGASYTIDNLADITRYHAHVSRGIIPTDNMADGLTAGAGISGPGRFHYPGKEGSSPSSFGPPQNHASPLPFFPDFRDGVGDYDNGYLDQGPIRYRFSCSTCHDPHGTELPNANPSAAGFPDLRMTRRAPNDLCRQCH